MSDKKNTSAHFGKEATVALVKGLETVATAVGSTLGPAGKTVVIQREDKFPLITKDGVSVAKEIHPKDEQIRLGADLAISIANKQMGSVGDGTTTATVLGNAIVNQGVRQIELSENTINRTALRKGIEKARDWTIEKLKSVATEITTQEQLVNIATVSANGDEKLGKVIADAYEKVGKNGVVMVEECKDRDIRLEVKEGMTFDKGWTSQFFVNNHESQTVEYDNPKILLCNTKISSLATLARVIEPVMKGGMPIVIIAEDFDSTVTQGLAMNIIRSGGQIKVACVTAPGYGDRRLDILRDMGIYLGATVADDPMGTKLEAISAVDFGTCEKIIIKKDETVISGGKGDPDAVNERIKSIQGMIDNLKENDTFEKEQLNKRLATLTTGVAVIKVGGSSEEEIKELRDRLDDAQWACKAAIEEGYLPGAGNTLLVLSENLMDGEMPENHDEALGVNIFKNALKVPFKTILANAGIDQTDVRNQILAKKDINYGYDARNLRLCNLIESGIIDPLKVVSGAVYAATSIASVVLTSSVIITEDPIEEKNGLSLSMMPPMM